MLSLSISKGQEQVDQFTGNNISMEDSFGELARKVLNTNINALNETFSMIKEEDIDRAITLILSLIHILFALNIIFIAEKVTDIGIISP